MDPNRAEEKEAEEERIVQEVLRDFPPEDRGLRSEWHEHVGWHRKENLRGGQRSAQPKQSSIEVEQPLPSNKHDVDHSGQIMSNNQGSPLLWHGMLILLVLLSIVVAWALRPLAKKRTK